MKIFDTELLPPARLAIVYAVPTVRDRFALLLQFDLRFADLVGKASEPLIGQMKLAWWRDVIEMTSDRRPSGEPLVGQLNKQSDTDIERTLLQLLTAWEGILIEDDWVDDALASFADKRGNAIFSAYAKWIGAEMGLPELGSIWAVNDLKMRFGGRVKQMLLPPPTPVPRDRRWRPLTILALSVCDISGARLLWHALTGR